jgi:Ca2+-binding RTX toxin-like protein
VIRKAFSVLAAATIVAAIGAASAAAKPGDLFIAGNEEDGESDVIRMDPKTGEVDPVAELPDGDGDHAAFGSDGRLYVSDENLPGIFRVNVKTGRAELFSDDAEFADAWALDVAPDGQLLLADIDAETVFGLKPPNPEANALVVHDEDFDIEGIAGAPNGKIYGTNFDDPPGVLEINPRTDSVGLVATFAGTEDAESLAATPDSRTLYVSRGDQIESYRVKSDSISTVSSDPDFGEPFDLELGFDGKLYVVDASTFVVHKVNPNSGGQKVLGATGMGNPLGIAVQPPKCAGKFATVVGTNKKDKIKGSKGADIIAGLKGNDVIRGLKGKDRLCGGKGKDKLIGGPKRDKLDGGPGKDRERQ